MQPSLSDILSRTPPQVWIILAVILALGLLQLRTRNVPRSRVMILPLAMVGLSIYTLVSGFQPWGSPIGFWAAGLGIAFGVNAALIRAPSGVTHDAETDTFRVPGSIIPMLVMLGIFGMNYFVGVTRALTPSRLQEPDFRMLVCGGLGLLTGLLVSRAARTLRVAK
ncbi:MAG TPA: hypothetical protein PK970_04090 [Hyphomicrobiaceae bacterium]|nr:hypothetical protein [Hyphomicrobiaceae bacterium]